MGIMVGCSAFLSLHRCLFCVLARLLREWSARQPRNVFRNG